MQSLASYAREDIEWARVNEREEAGERRREWWISEAWGLWMGDEELESVWEFNKSYIPSVADSNNQGKLYRIIRLE